MTEAPMKRSVKGSTGWRRLSREEQGYSCRAARFGSQHPVGLKHLRFQVQVSAIFWSPRYCTPQCT